MTDTPKHIHFVGICGVGTSALAIAFHRAGIHVSGSDKGFFPPISTALEHAGVDFYAGWHPENIERNIATHGPIDFIVAGGIGTSSQNPELNFAKEHNIPIVSFAEAVGHYIVKKNSIVCVGTWGKTSSASLLAHILENAGVNPSYFAGGLSVGRDAGKVSDGDWSVVEGDEYKAAIWDERPKFAFYKPTHLLLTSVSWDHADLYPTEKSYLDTFNNLIESLPREGKIVYCMDNLIAHGLVHGKHNAITYGKDAGAQYRYEGVKESKNGITFTLYHGGKLYQISSPILGAFQAENITGCFAMAHSIGVKPEAIIEAIGSFKGMKRRLEKRFENTNVAVIDDIAHSPEKAKSALATLRAVYSGNIITVFEPNIGGRRPEAKSMYKNAFKDSDAVVIPRLSKLKAAADGSTTEAPLEGNQLAAVIEETHSHTHYFEDDTALVQHLLDETKEGGVIAFLGSHGFRGMIEDVIKQLSKIRSTDTL